MSTASVGSTWAVALVGMEGHLIEVEAVLLSALPGFMIVGLPDTALGEARERVRAAVSSTGVTWPQRKVVVNLSPASLPKSGSGFDLAVTMGVLAAAGVIEQSSARAWVHLGELGLDGSVRAVRGVLPAVRAAILAGHTRIIVPRDNEAEAKLIPGAEIIAVNHLADVIHHHGGTCPEHIAPPTVPPSEPVQPPAEGRKDLCDVLGQHGARFALEVAAAGGHHMLMTGPPGAGKTMLASRLSGILPDLGDTEAVEVTAVHSIAGILDPSAGLIRRPPFIAPHHTATAASIIGGGSGAPKPGAISQAHHGVLFFDEAPEFGTSVLQTLRQPLESGSVTIHRAHGQATYPARFQLILAANPCPCGKGYGPTLECTCTPQSKRRYFGRLSGPLLDRVDIRCDVSPPLAADRMGGKAESSQSVSQRVLAARQRSGDRLSGTKWRLNADVPGSWWRRNHRLPTTATSRLDRALDRGMLTMRGYDRTVRLSWTISDLKGIDHPGVDEIDMALMLRGALP